MELRLLKYFLAVAEELHFGRAAKRLCISQPPLSQQVMKLEEELGTKLFVRTKRNVQLTESGNTLVHYANKILDLTELAKAEVGEIAAGSKGLLSLGYVGPAMDGFLPKIINAFKLRYPGVELRLRQMTTSEQLSGIREGMVHAGIVRISGQDTKGLEAIPVHQETYLLAIPSYYPLAHNRSVSIGELADQPMIFLPQKQSAGIIQTMARYLYSRGLFSEYRPGIHIVSQLNCSC